MQEEKMNEFHWGGVLISLVIDHIDPILLKDATHRAVIMNTPYGLAQEVCYWQDCELGKIVLLWHWNRVCYDNLLKKTTR